VYEQFQHPLRRDKDPMVAQLFQQRLNQQIRPSNVLGDWGKPRQVVTETGPIETPVTESFHEFGKLFAPGLIPLAVQSAAGAS
jgi:hypothetical protein